jgi:hypothetical protein
MKALPVEGNYPFAQNPQKRKNQANPRLVKYKIAVKKLSKRLNEYADHELGERDILLLLQDTRSQVINLHVARQQLRRKPGRKDRRSR